MSSNNVREHYLDLPDYVQTTANVLQEATQEFFAFVKPDEDILPEIALSSPNESKWENIIDDIKHNMTMASLRNVFSKFGVVNDNEEILKSHEYKNLLNLKSNSINQVVGSLSGGNQQKVVLAKWMLSNPDVLILDEPTRGIDVGAKYEIYCVINDLVKMGKAVIIISSELPEVIGMSDRVYVLNEGKIVGELKEDINQVNIMKCIIQDS